DLSEAADLKSAANLLQHLHKESVVKNQFKPLWNKCEATDPYNIAGILCSNTVIKCIQKLIKTRFNEKCDDDVILSSIHKIVAEKMDPALIKVVKVAKPRIKREKKSEEPSETEATPGVISNENS